MQDSADMLKLKRTISILMQLNFFKNLLGTKHVKAEQPLI